jgi:aminoglycoside 3-N-acetyltransferase
VLLLGCGYDACTALHLAEYKLPNPVRRGYSALRAVPGGRVNEEFSDIAFDDSDFAQLGADLERGGAVTLGMVGGAAGRIVTMKRLVDFAVGWMTDNRRAPLAS